VKKSCKSSKNLFCIYVILVSLFSAREIWHATIISRILRFHQNENGEIMKSFVRGEIQISILLLRYRKRLLWFLSRDYSESYRARSYSWFRSSIKSVFENYIRIGPSLFSPSSMNLELIFFISDDKFHVTSNEKPAQFSPLPTDRPIDSLAALRARNDRCVLFNQARWIRELAFFVGTRKLQVYYTTA